MKLIKNTDNQSNRRLAFRFFLVISAVCFFILTLGMFYTNYFIFEDYQPSLIVFKNKYSQKISGRELLIKDVFRTEFIARANNLGIISINFNTFNRVNNDQLIFRIKEKGGGWLYQNKYSTFGISNKSFFPFGFPPIKNSQGKVYIFELESISGKKGNSVALNLNLPYFLTKYHYPKKYLLSDYKNTIDYLLKKIESLINPTSVFLFIFSLVFPSLIYLFITYFNIFKNVFRQFNIVLNTYYNDKLSNIFYLVSVFIFTFIIAAIFARISVDPHHDGILIKPAFDVLDGKMLFKQTYNQYGALTVLIQALALLIFGRYLIVIRLLTALFYGLSSVFLWLIIKRFTPKLISGLICVIWILLAPFYRIIFLPWSSIYALFTTLLTAYFLILSIEKKNVIWLFLSGITSGLTFWFKQPNGIYLTTAIFIYFLILKLLHIRSSSTHTRQMKLFFLGFFSVCAIILLWLFVNGAVIDWFKQSILLAFNFAVSVGSKNDNFIIGLFNAFFPPSLGPISVWALPPMVVIILLIKAFYIIKSSTTDKSYHLKILSLSLVALSSWLNYFPVNDIRHTFWASPLLIGLLIYGIWEMLKSIKAGTSFFDWLIKIFIFMFFLLIIFFVDIRARLGFALQKFNQRYYSVSQPKVLKYMLLTKEEAEDYYYFSRQMDNFFSKYPNFNLITIGQNALYFTFNSHASNFHPFYIYEGLLLNSGLYPDFTDKLNKQIAYEKVLIIANSPYYPRNYCKLTNHVNRVDNTFLIAPCSLIKNN